MLNAQDLSQKLAYLNLPSFRFKQIIEYICQKSLADFDLFTSLPLVLRNELKSGLVIFSIKPILISKSSNSDTIKVLFETVDGKKIESVLMRFQDGRNSVCISTQAGCQMGCRFCATGKLGLLKNLTYSEIFDQVLYFSHFLAKENQKISNIVLMGMGEPMMNYDSCLEAMDMVSSPVYLGISPRRITFSTSGIVHGIEKLAQEKKQYNLAISLHAPNQADREKIMPIAKIWPIEKLMEAIENYIKITNRRVSYEYVMLKNINDSKEQAEQLANLIKNQLCHVNLIPYNHTSADFTSTERNKITEFKKILEKYGINATIRVTMGQDIAAACGQLANINQTNEQSKQSKHTVESGK